MKLEIIEVQNPKENEQKVEKIFFRAEKGANLKNYLLYDSTFTDDEIPSNKGRHVYRFPNFPITEDCSICLWIARGPRKGEPAKVNKTNSRRFFWNRVSPIINNTGDSLTLIRISDEQIFDVPAE